MKILTSTFILLLIPLTIQAADCPPLTVQGNTEWLNNGQSSLVSELTREFRGSSCKDEFYAIGMKNEKVDFSYMMSHLSSNNDLETDSNFQYSFSLDFSEILQQLDHSKNVDIFELYAIPVRYVSPNLIDSKILSINIHKRPNRSSDYNNYDWGLEFQWLGLIDGSSNQTILKTENIEISGAVAGGLLHFNVFWDSHNLKGGSANVAINSSLYYIDRITGSENELGIYASDGTINKYQVMFFGENFTKETAPSMFKIGIINENSGVSFGDGIVFYTPWRE